MVKGCHCSVVRMTTASWERRRTRQTSEMHRTTYTLQPLGQSMSIQLTARHSGHPLHLSKMPDCRFTPASREPHRCRANRVYSDDARRGQVTRQDETSLSKANETFQRIIVILYNELSIVKGKNPKRNREKESLR